MADRIRTSAVAVLAGLALAASPVASAAPATVPTAQLPADGQSAEVRGLAQWVIATGDAHGGPFLIVDKVRAQIVAFDPQGVPQGSAPALLGAARGDISPPGIGEMTLAQITPAMRITPAGRFEAAFGRDLGPNDVLWVDYADAISLHRVVTSKPAERRLQRLASTTPLDNRISYGCINVSVHFYEYVVQPLFRPANGIVYILPETKPFGELIAKIASDRPKVLP